MKKQIWMLRAILLMVLCMICVPVSAFAAEAESIAATIPVSVSVSGKAGVLKSEIPSETYTLQITAVNQTPMPENDTLTIKGAGKAEFHITYTTVGVYQYKVTQDISSLTGKSSGRGNYDESVYYVTVNVTYLDDGGYGVTVAACKDSTSAQKSDIVFENSYTSVPSVTPTPTVQITGTGNNTGSKLIQTGQLRWPIPVLLAVGGILLLRGLYTMRGKKERKDE